MALGTLRVVILWHMHQPYYKDLVTGDYRLPWVRMHALKDYYGMVKLLDEFPDVHVNFNLVPSLIKQIEEYASAQFRDPFYDLVSKPASQLSADERRFALQYLFQAHPDRMIGRYPRYRSLFEKVQSVGPDPTKAERLFTDRDYADLQVLSQLAWFDEYYLAEPSVAALVAKGEGFTEGDQRQMLSVQHRLINAVLPAYASASKRGIVELSTTPFYHPILPLICDTNAGGLSSPGLPLPTTRFLHPDDAHEQVKRAVDLHMETFGSAPKGMWPSEGSVSDQAISVGAANGIKWMATDEGVLGRTIGFNFDRDGIGSLRFEGAERLYNLYKYESDDAEMNLIFRDHRLSDLVGFVYSGMPPLDAASHLIGSIKAQAEPLLKSGRDAVVPIILDGENAWESFPQSGREFLRRVYDRLSKDPQIEAVTISEAIERHKPQSFGRISSIVPGSWINANFNVWIGAPEDNRAWDYLAHARDFYDENAPKARLEKRELAYEELLIAEGSDWNWWYGPEHHSANDRDFDELYRKHLSNVYTALGAVAPDHLARPIAGGVTKPVLVAQSAYVHPVIDGDASSYFSWMGAAMYTTDRRTGSMHGKQFLLERVYAGIDEENLYARLDFSSFVPQDELIIVVQCSVAQSASNKQSENGNRRMYSMNVTTRAGKVEDWTLIDDANEKVIASRPDAKGIVAAMARVFEFSIPLDLINATMGSDVNVRFTVFRGMLPVDSLPVEGSLNVRVRPEDTLIEHSYIDVH